jgi:rubrerythrin
MTELNSLATPMDILKAALRKEHAAHEFYAALRDHSHVALIRDLVMNLCEEEVRHIRLIERKIAELELG